MREVCLRQRHVYERGRPAIRMSYVSLLDYYSGCGYRACNCRLRSGSRRPRSNDLVKLAVCISTVLYVESWDIIAIKDAVTKTTRARKWTNNQ
jgi:hypothetical protein